MIPTANSEPSFELVPESLLQLRGYPTRRPHLRVLPFERYIKVMNFHDGSSRLVPPTQASILELCSGEYAVEEITDICRQAFRLSPADAAKEVMKTLQGFGDGLVFHQQPSERPLPSDPLRLFASRRSHRIGNQLRDDYPSELTMSLTLRCDRRCCYCSVNAGAALPDELTGEQWCQVIDEAAELGTAGVVFSGGEPLLHPAAFVVAERTVARGMYPMILTNGGCLGGDTIARLADTGARFIHLSLPAVKAPLYGQIAGASADGLAVARSLHDLKAAGFYVRVKTVLMPINLSEVESIVELCAECGVDHVHFEPFRLTHAGRGGPELVPSTADLQSVCDRVASKADALGIRNAVALPLASSLMWNDASCITRCGGVKSDLVILANGHVALCEALGLTSPEFVYGNVREQSLQDIWESRGPDDVNRLRRERTEEPCRSCEHLESCQTGCFVCSLVYSGNAWAVDPRCWKARIADNAFHERRRGDAVVGQRCPSRELANLRVAG